MVAKTDIAMNIQLICTEECTNVSGALNLIITGVIFVTDFILPVRMLEKSSKGSGRAERSSYE